MYVLGSIEPVSQFFRFYSFIMASLPMEFLEAILIQLLKI
jgi:hypothetical protein